MDASNAGANLYFIGGSKRVANVAVDAGFVRENVRHRCKHADRECPCNWVVAFKYCMDAFYNQINIENLAQFFLATMKDFQNTISQEIVPTLKGISQLEKCAVADFSRGLTLQ